MLTEELAIPAPTITSRADAFRYRITFAKTSEMRYTSHLDVQRAWDRLLRRARIPLLFTQGFHTRARFSLGSALPLGFTGSGELAEIYLVESLSPNDLAARIEASAPPGIRIVGVEPVDVRAPAVQTLIRAAVYRVDARGVDDVEELDHRIHRLLAANEFPWERRGKRYDLRPLIEHVAIVAGVHPNEPGRAVLDMTLSARDGATGRPDDVLRVLGLDPSLAFVVRERLVLEPA
jgi:radical SAM-linked protein